MSHQHHDHGQLGSGVSPGPGRALRRNVAFAVFLAIALFFLLTEHRAHFFGVLPYLLILACPLMHLFHHGGHGGHDGPGRTSEERRT
ncbi:MAG: DUF2933 domain-containing protein [Burkholderiales bacterium]|nr:DUF2933 domain-containing protein [Burkholderiales bacterium]